MSTTRAHKIRQGRLSDCPTISHEQFALLACREPNEAEEAEINKSIAESLAYLRKTTPVRGCASLLECEREPRVYPWRYVETHEIDWE